MTKTLISDAITFESISLFLKEEKAIVAANELLVEEAAAFEIIHTAFKEAKNESSKTAPLKTSDKNTIKKYLLDTTRTLLTYLLSFGTSKGLTDLIVFCQSAPKSLSKLSDEELKNLVKETVHQMTVYSTELLRYRFTLEKQTYFAKQVTAFDNIKSQLNIEVSRTTSKGNTLSDKYKALKAFIKVRLDAAVLTEEETNPSFVKLYQDLRLTTAPKKTSTSLIIKTLNDNTKTFEPFVDITIEALKFVGKTDETGKISIKTGLLKNVTIVASKSELKTQIVTVNNILRGRIRNVDIVLL